MTILKHPIFLIPKSMKSILFLVFSLCFSGFITGQKKLTEAFQGDAEDQIIFTAHEKQRYGFDNFHLKAWDEQPNVINGEDDFKYIVPVKSIAPAKTDWVKAVLIGDFDSLQLLRFEIQGDTTALIYNIINDTVVELKIPASELNYQILAKYDGDLYGALDVIVYPEKFYDLVLVPTLDFPFNIDTLKAEIHRILYAANIKVRINIAPKFENKNFGSATIYDNPDTSRMREYTDQMFKLNQAHELNYKGNPSEYKIFIISQFKDSLISGYMGLGNRTGYVAKGSEQHMAQSIVVQLARGLGYTNRLKPQFPVDSTSRYNLSFWDWEQIRNGEAGAFAWVDPDKTNRVGALSAFYFWEENPDGTIIEASFKRPYKRNFTVLALDKVKRNQLSEEKVIYAVGQLIGDKSTQQQTTFDFKNAKGVTERFQIPLKKAFAGEMGSNVFRKKDGIWESTKWKNVLYFNVFSDSLRKFSHANDSLILSKYNIKLHANGHYLVKTYWRKDGKIARQEVFAYNGENVTKYIREIELSKFIEQIVQKKQ